MVQETRHFNPDRHSRAPHEVGSPLWESGNPEKTIWIPGLRPGMTEAIEINMMYEQNQAASYRFPEHPESI